MSGRHFQKRWKPFPGNVWNAVFVQKSADFCGNMEIPNGLPRGLIFSKSNIRSWPMRAIYAICVPPFVPKVRHPTSCPRTPGKILFCAFNRAAGHGHLLPSKDSHKVEAQDRGILVFKNTSEMTGIVAALEELTD